MRGSKHQTGTLTVEPEGEDVEETLAEKSGFFACYLLCSLCPRYKGHTYIGFTVNPRRRIRQHNGEIRCGAWRTKSKRPWEMVLCIHGFPSKVSALQFEWAWQHPRESKAVREAASSFKSLSGLMNKMKLAYTMLTLPQWERFSLSVNFFSTKYTSHSAHCPRLPKHMRTTVLPMDELPCYTENITFDEDDDDGDDLDHRHVLEEREERIDEPICRPKDVESDEELRMHTLKKIQSEGGNALDHHHVLEEREEHIDEPICRSKDVESDEELRAHTLKKTQSEGGDDRPSRRNLGRMGRPSPPRTAGHGTSLEVIDLSTPSSCRVGSFRNSASICAEVIDLTGSPF
ncbi:unnamed protein product [Spirodela intermedia]|uniref:Structure-specific endonuclease subunit SLX1 homolog n=1 Tax=Spirodela intermedia TaxID=51605 RepID=A0A7I8L9V2_SPIIN|nr:unnamed protein product [Spirodela intermedia]